MVNIKAKRVEKGVVTHLKTEYGNVMSREAVVDKIKSGYRFYTIFSGQVSDEIYLVEKDNKKFLSTNNKIFGFDSIERLPIF